MIVDDDQQAAAPLHGLLEAEGYSVTHVSRLEEAADQIARQRPDAVLLSLHPQTVAGLELLAKIRFRSSSTTVVVVADPTEWAREAMRLGAFECLGRPLRTDQLLRTLQRAVELRRPGRGVLPDRQVGGRPRIFVGESAPVQHMFDLIERVAPLNLTVLVTGETGTGKELVARSIHERSRRRERRFVPVHCSALSPGLLESELFGHVRGSFTGATTMRRGLFEEASGGTLFLDEIATISPETQVKTLRVLQERKVQRVGSCEEIDTDFRLVGATNVDLEAEVNAGTFRKDLFYRLNVYPIRVPPLRERREDIPLLADAFRQRFAEENEIDPPEIPSDVQAQMMEYVWPGNVRELENFIERALVVYAGQAAIRFDLASPAPAPAGKPEQSVFTAAGSDDWTLARLEREHIARVMARTGGRQTEAARILGISRRTLYRRLQHYYAAEPSGAASASWA
ncbi:MAG TPA: sigma-54 dependent transcriptional regulator [Gemmatimonadaceae bacterium]|nr:sigma-54 dependent transcriptional regulator [Gemmatimonadaceae bacterium]